MLCQGVRQFVVEKGLFGDKLGKANHACPYIEWAWVLVNLMDKKQKLTLIIAGVVELAVIVFCMVTAILVLTCGYSSASDDAKYVWYDNHPDMIGWMCTHRTGFFLICVLPPIALFIADGIYLILYATKKESLLSKEEKDAITEEAKRQAKEEILKELRSEESSDEAKPE